MDKVVDDENLQKSIEYLQKIEFLAEEILSDKREIIELSNQMNKNREALRAIQKSMKNKQWICIGGMILKTAKQQCEEVILKDQTKIEAQINILRSDLKVKVNKLRDLEYLPPVPGLMLNPLSGEEMNAVRQVMGGRAL